MKETTIKELYEKNPDMRVLIDDEGKVTLKEPTGRWKPEFGEQYWFINSNGYISSSFWEGGLMGDERNRYELSNVFATTSEAKTAGERLRIRAELLDCGGKEVFEVSTRPTYAIGCSSTGDFYTSCTCVPDLGTICFESSEELRSAIEKVGKERVKKYMFGVDEASNEIK